ncbi:SAV_915 family protein [Nocardioides sp.]|uniref:SAV_915 family protein n=1 Tax=Nocardioides sp. TaxID=35761 RepID=UPI002ED35CB3
MERPALPPVVYVPTITDEDGANRLRMHELRDGRVALFVYSAIDRLEEQYGEGHPWALLSVPNLQLAHERAPFDLLLLDRDLHPREEAAHG